MTSPRTLAAAFDHRANGLNFLRLCLAVGVIVWHSFRLTGHDIGWAPARQLMAEVWVDGFFAISGFLIVSSWVRRPSAGNFLRARALRIFPGFWVCLVVTAAVLAPLGVLLGGAGLPSGYAPEAVQYVVGQVGLRPLGGSDLSGTPVDVPFPGVWNGSLWTLQWEFLCYLGVLALGVLGLVKRSWAIPAVFGASLFLLVATAYGPVDNYELVNGARFAVMFAAGAMVWRFQRRLLVTPALMVAAGLIVLAASFLEDYRLVAALPLAYLLMAGASVIRSPRLRCEFDMSYGMYVYAFPVQQVLACAGLWRAGVLPFALAAIACTIPLAAVSWRFIERPALALKQRGRTPLTVQERAITGPGSYRAAVSRYSDMPARELGYFRRAWEAFKGDLPWRERTRCAHCGNPLNGRPAPYCSQGCAERDEDFAAW